MGNDPHRFFVGDTCNTCIGILFDPVRTPYYLAVEFTGIVKLFDGWPDPPNGQRFILIETDFCYWFLHILIGLYHLQVWVYLDFHGGGTHIKAKFTGWPDDYAFFFEDPEPCLIEGNSELPDPGDPQKDAYSGGHGKINWGSAINESAFNEQDLGIM